MAKINYFVLNQQHEKDNSTATETATEKKILRLEPSAVDVNKPISALAGVQ
jgi:hypothetical protein